MDRLSTTAAYAVLAIWGMSALDAIARAEYEALRYTTPIMAVLAAALWGIKVVRNGRRNGNSDDR